MSSEVSSGASSWGIGEGPGDLLVHDGVTDVWRVGMTVRRPIRPFTPSVHALLRHLRSAGIDFVPEPLGLDERGREVLSYVEGDVPHEPVPAWVWEDEVLACLAGLVRRLHDAADGWQPPPDAVWGSLPGQHLVDVPPLFDRPELVAHQDYCPGNVVFRAGRPAAIIDFDLARPTPRVADCVNAMYWWVPLLDPADRTPAARALDAGLRLRVFADAYGMTAAQRGDVVRVARQRAANSPVLLAAAAEADPVFRRWWQGGWAERLRRSEEWLHRSADALEQALV